MIDLHQGVTGEELRELEPGLGSVALAQLDSLGSLLKGDLGAAARKQVDTWRLLGRALVAGVKSKLPGRPK
ncbi:MAG TPA: hypothetical protein VKN99_05190 [Polyangia bacterium]|nr:hypothetical protein [Polyangia bacterium]